MTPNQTLKTAHPPKDKPLLVWDGNCEFCRYWVQRWEQFFGDKLNYEPYQTAASRFPDMDRDQFKKAVQLIETDGRVFPGAATVFHSLCVGKPQICFPEELYQQSKLFRQISDGVYGMIADNRPILYRATVSLFGKNPARSKPYWAYWLAGLAGAGVMVTLASRTKRKS
jgi:predicted DCC family thiol-disulfide oxidoreductase YuxK